MFQVIVPHCYELIDYKYSALCRAIVQPDDHAIFMQIADRIHIRINKGHGNASLSFLIVKKHFLVLYS